MAAHERQLPVTITVAWIRRNKKTIELVIASDSRLRSYGPMDQSQKLFPLARGDSALGFCGDADVAYPFFVQAGSALNSFIKSRTRANDISVTARALGLVLNGLIESWSITPEEKRGFLKETRILFAGWSWRKAEFEIGFFKYIDGKFVFLRAQERLPKPWREVYPSLLVLGDYRGDYLKQLGLLLEGRHPKKHKNVPVLVNLEYEPLKALSEFLNDPLTRSERGEIGGQCQAVKVYAHSNVVPLVIRTGESQNYLFGRKLRSWEKSEYPIADLTGSAVKFHYPMSAIPFADDVGRAKPDTGSGAIKNFIRFLTSRGSSL